MTPKEQSRNIIDLIQQLDEIEQLIMLAGIRALTSKAFDIPTYMAWVDDRVTRHRAGEKLRLSDLETPPAPPTGQA